MITQKIRTMMSEVDRHIQKKERLKAMSKIEDIVEEFNKVKQELETHSGELNLFKSNSSSSNTSQ